MELKDLKYFVEIADQQSMRKAAMVLYVTQPNLSRSVKNLEDEMGTKLFVRTNHGVKLTPVGESVYAYARSIIKQMDGIEAIKKISNEKYLRKELKISLASIILSDDIIPQYFHQLDSSHSNISLRETSVEEVLQHVTNLTSEIGIICINDLQEPFLKKLMEINGLELHLISTGPLYVHVGPQHPLYGREGIEARELLPYTYIHVPMDLFANFDNLIQLGDIHIMDFTRTLIINNYHAIINMLKRTDAFVFGNPWQVSEMKKGRVGSVLLHNCDVQKQLFWIKRKKEVLSSQAERFLDMIMQWYGEGQELP